MATVTLVPGIDMINIEDRRFTPCQTGSPDAGQDHFVHTQLDGSLEKVCLDKVAVLMQKAGAQSPQHWWFLARSKHIDDLAPLIADGTVSAEARLDAAMATIGGNPYYNAYIITDADKATIVRFAESHLNDPKLNARAAQIICAFSGIPDISRLQDRLAAIVLETQNPDLRDAVAQRLRNVTLQTSTRTALFAMIAKHLDMRPAVSSPALDLPNEGPYNLDPLPAVGVYNLYQAVRDRIGAVQRENPVHCSSLGGEAFCSPSVFPEIPWYHAFMATLAIPIEQLSPKRRQQSLQCIREIVIRVYENQYGDSDAIREIYGRFMQLDREEAVTYAEQVSRPNWQMTNAILSDFEKQPNWDEVRLREGQLLLRWATLDSSRNYSSYTLPDCDDFRVRSVIAAHPHPSFKAAVQDHADQLVDYYDREYRYHDDHRNKMTQKIETWRDEVIAKMDSGS